MDMYPNTRKNIRGSVLPQRISYIHLCLRFQIIINGHIEIQQLLIRGFPVSDHIPESPGFCLSHIIPRHMHIAAFTVGHTRRAVYHRKQVVSLIPDRSDLVKTIGHADFSACFRGVRAASGECRFCNGCLPNSQLYYSKKQRRCQDGFLKFVHAFWSDMA